MNVFMEKWENYYIYVNNSYLEEENLYKVLEKSISR